MTAQRYRAELEALKYDSCQECGPDSEFPTTELLSCPHCQGALFCSFHSIRDLDCCKGLDCVIKAANALRLQLIDMRELRGAAIAVLGATTPLAWQWCLRTALEILVHLNNDKGEKR